MGLEGGLINLNHNNIVRTDNHSRIVTEILNLYGIDVIKDFMARSSYMINDPEVGLPTHKVADIIYSMLNFMESVDYDSWLTDFYRTIYGKLVSFDDNDMWLYITEHDDRYMSFEQV